MTSSCPMHRDMLRQAYDISCCRMTLSALEGVYARRTCVCLATRRHSALVNAPVAMNISGSSAVTSTVSDSSPKSTRVSSSADSKPPNPQIVSTPHSRPGHRRCQPAFHQLPGTPAAARLARVASARTEAGSRPASTSARWKLCLDTGPCHAI